MSRWKRVVGGLAALVAWIAFLAIVQDKAEAATPPLRVCTANIQHTPDMPDWKVRQDAAEVRGRCDVVLWQEIRERADHRALQARGWRVTPYGAGGVPVSWRTSKLAKDSEAHIRRVSAPTPRCGNGAPSYNPSRYIGSVRLRVRATGQRFTAVSLHFPQRRTKCYQAITSQRWHEAFRNTRAALPSGAVVVGGDWNRREGEIPDMVAGQHWVTNGSRTLDHVFVARSSWRTVSRFDFDLWSDHRARGSNMDVRKRR
jgi:hypothetical protein